MLKNIEDTFMEHGIPHRRRYRGAIALLVGISTTSSILWLTQANVQEQLQGVKETLSPRLELPYRYPFANLLRHDRRPTARLEQEIAHYQQQLRHNPESGLMAAALASSYLQMGRLTGQGSWYLLAEQTAQQSLSHLPVYNDDAILVLARVAEANHAFPAAIQLAKQLTHEQDALSIQTTSYLALGNLPQARQAADRLVDLSLSPHAFMLQGLVANAQGQDQQTLQSFTHALSLEEPGDLSTSARIRTLLGRYYADRGQLEQAEALYQEALQILPQSPSTLLNLAQLQVRQGKFDPADRLYKTVMAQSQGNPTLYTPLVLRGRAILHRLQGNEAKAIAYWSEAEAQLRQTLSQSETTSYGHRRDLARLLLERGRSPDGPEALSLMEAEVKQRTDAATLDTYAWALRQNRRWAEAQQVMQRAIATGTQNPAILYHAGRIEQELGKASSAQKYLQQARQIDPLFDDRAYQVSNLLVGLGS